MRLQLLGSFLLLSFMCHAQEFDDLPDWTRVGYESGFERTEKKKQDEFEKVYNFIQPRVRAATLNWFRTKFCAEFENNFRHTRVGNYTIVDAVLHRIALKIGLEFISVAFVMLMNGVDIEHVSSLTVTNMCNALIQTQTEKALAALIPYVTTKPVWRMCENCIRADIAAHLIKATQTIVLPALKASALECGKQAIALQKKEDKRIAHFFNDSKHALNGGLSPKLIRLIKQQKNTK